MNKKLTISNYIFILSLLLLIICVQIILLKKIPKIEVIIGLNGVIFTIFLLLFLTKKFSNIFIILYFLPLMLLSNSVHYQIKYELLFAFPIFILAIYTLVTSILNPSREEIGKYLSKPILIFLFYYLLSAVLGIFYGNHKGFIFIETFHFLLFASIILFRYNLTSREDYFLIFKSLLIIFLIISFEYIYLGAIISGNRFVTFQSGFLPLISGVLFSYFLLSENSIKKIIISIVLTIIILAMVSTLTRSLWVTTAITMSTVYLIYLWANNKLTIFKKIMILVLFIVSIVVVVKTINSTQTKTALGSSEKVEDRAQSIANPTEDHSFLMRVEMGWYAIQKIAENPILGWGLGDILRYQFLGNSKLLNNYLDNTWLYFLWKGGVIGFILVLFVFYRSVRVGLEVIIQTDNKNVKMLVIGLIAGLIGIMALGFLSPLVIKYRTNVLFPLIWGYLEFEYNKLPRTKVQIDL